MIFKRRSPLVINSVQKGTLQPRYLSFLTLQRGNAVRDALSHQLRRATHSREDAERPERHAHAEHGHDSVLQDAYHPSHPSPDTHRSSRSAWECRS
ncbi:DUF1534 domain-containing protein [Pseudomonas syringae]|nr:DUF1534 domain-containing protein [Pseudomonas syringae]MCF5209738.1 DUF1534 domain-containing protein [Pseudomonas syringae]MCF5215527.1 DUF1534 domain-containing protein [Pseudomonas syringae]MCF5219351.1 DUF1534 domain-containing protein [Pseudomonas syringae]MCF5267239.1 DUF1534 domain-containing protein [Pseudomonas syringae]